MEVVKRNGAIVPFDGRKIQVAIRKAGDVSDNTVWVIVTGKQIGRAHV